MKSPFQRIAALALCFTLTLGAFAYRPSEAKAIAGVDDAVVIGALLSAFAGGCGLIFSNNGMTSNEIAQGMTQKWNEFKAAVLETDTTFAGWLGYEDTVQRAIMAFVARPAICACMISGRSRKTRLARISALSGRASSGSSEGIEISILPLTNSAAWI